MSIVHEKIGELLGKAHKQRQVEEALHGVDRFLSGISTKDLETLMTLVHSHGVTAESKYLDDKVADELKRRKVNFETPESLDE